MITALRVFRVLFATVGLWQIIGIVPAVTWISNPQAVTLGMVAGIVFKAVAATSCAGAFYWLGKLKRKRSTAKERISDVAIAGISLVVALTVVVGVAVILPSGSNPKNSDLLNSTGAARATTQLDTTIWGSFAADGWTQESTNSTEAGPWLNYDPPGTRYCRYADGTIQRVYPPGVKPNAPRVNPFCLHDSTLHVPQ